MRSGTTELVRKAEVVNTVATTIIPEHVKPILKKRAGTLRSDGWEGDAKRSISPKRKEEILGRTHPFLHNLRAGAEV